MYAQKKVPTAAIMELESQTLDKATAQSITDAVADEVLKSKSVRLMERSQMDRILQEQGFQKSGACDGTECAVEVGKLLSIDQIIIGSIGEIGESHTISLRLVNINSGEIINSARIMQRGKIDEIVANAVPKIVHQLFFDSNEIKATNITVIAHPKSRNDTNKIENRISKPKINSGIPEPEKRKSSLVTRIITGGTAIGCAIGAWQIEKQYQDDLSLYKKNNNGSSSGISRSSSTKFGEITLLTISALSTVLFGLTFTF